MEWNSIASSEKIEAEMPFEKRLDARGHLIKTKIENASLTKIQEAFDAIEVKQYERTDIPGPRIGFIADDFQAALPEEFDNIVHSHYTEDGNMLALDYARLGSTLLWGVCKNQQERISRLETTVGEILKLL